MMVSTLSKTEDSREDLLGDISVVLTSFSDSFPQSYQWDRKAVNSFDFMRILAKAVRGLTLNIDRCSTSNGCHWGENWKISLHLFVHDYITSLNFPQLIRNSEFKI